MTFAVVGGTQSTGDLITNSLRFNNDDDPYLLRTPSSTGDQRTFTFSVWLKQAFGQPSGNHVIFSAGSDGDNYDQLRIKSNGFLQFESEVSNSVKSDIYTTHFFRDPTAWYHLVLRVDTTQSTAADRVRFYKDGTLLTTAGGSQPDQNQQLNTNTQIGHAIGTLWRGSDNGNEWDGYMANAHFADGQSYAPTQFAETDDNGFWVPKQFAGSFGTNGFKLEFKQTGTSANASGIGADTGGNGHHHSVNGLAAIDVVTDTPQNNFATLNPLDERQGATFSEGNCKIVTSSSNRNYVISTIGVTSGKWYCEAKITGGADNHYSWFGTADFDDLLTSSASTLGDNSNEVGFNAEGGYQKNNSNTNGYAGDIDDDDIVGIALDLDNNRITHHKNGQYANGSGSYNQSSPSSYVSFTNSTMGFAFGDGAGADTATFLVNFGNSSFAISSGNSDANGHGNFEYEVPSGYYALNTKNLAEYG